MSRGKRGDLPANGGLPGPGVRLRTKEKAHAAGLVGDVSFGEGVSAMDEAEKRGKRRPAGPSRASRPARPFRPRGAAGERGGDGM